MARRLPPSARLNNCAATASGSRPNRRRNRMSKYIYRIAGTLALSATAVLGACSDKKSDTLAQDTSLNRDLQMANQDTTAQPALQDVPTTGTPSATAPVTSAPSRTTTRPRSTGTVTRTPPRTTPRTTTPSAPTTTTASGNTV